MNFNFKNNLIALIVLFFSNTVFADINSALLVDLISGDWQCNKMYIQPNPTVWSPDNWSKDYKAGCNVNPAKRSNYSECNMNWYKGVYWTSTKNGQANTQRARLNFKSDKTLEYYTTYNIDKNHKIKPYYSNKKDYSWAVDGFSLNLYRGSDSPITFKRISFDKFPLTNYVDIENVMSLYINNNERISCVRFSTK